jgi:hypothetical protein
MSAQTSVLDVIRRTREVADYQHDPARSGRPVFLAFAGSVLAAVAAGLCAFLAYDIWYTREVPSSSGIYGVSLLFCLYVAGAYVFALAWELYDVARALRLTIVLALLGVVALVFMIGTLIALAFVKTGAGIAVSEQQGEKVIGALSYIGSGGEEDGPPKATPVPGFAMVTCKSCERQFFPLPPKAICPWCDTAFLSA